MRALLFIGLAPRFVAAWLRLIDHATHAVGGAIGETHQGSAGSAAPPTWYLHDTRAHRVLIETDEQGRPKDLPSLPLHAKLEAIFLVLEEGAPPKAERRPPPSLAGLKVVGDIVAPAIDDSDWAITS